MTLVDNFSRESLALRAAQRFRGDDVVKALETVTAERGLPRTIRVDNGLELISKPLDLDAAHYAVQPAGKQFDACDPDNRLVADELERRRNAALDQV